MSKFMQEALKEAKKSLEFDEVPIGAIIVKNDEIIGRGFNKKETSKLATAHAEICAIEEACKNIGDWRLSECTLYVTVEPCLMCCGAIIQSRIKRIVYATPNEKFGYVESIDSVLNNPKSNHQVIIEKEECEEATILLKEFFKKKRK